MAESWTMPASAPNDSNPLVLITSQYPIRTILASRLRPDDVVNLTSTCQLIHHHINMHNPKTKSNLLLKTLCPGRGLEMRKQFHCPCLTADWHQLIGCAGQGFDTESRPCADCGVNTCNECRIHVTYQALVEDPGLQKHRWWAGYILTNWKPYIMYPPRGSEKASWKLPMAALKPQHDKGRVHLGFQLDAIADPEPLDRILDANLGQQRILPYGRTQAPFMYNKILTVFNAYASHRIQMICPSCSAKLEKEEAEFCSCTFRKRFIERWTCLPCHMKGAMRQQPCEMNNQRFPHQPLRYQCSCGVYSGSVYCAPVCRWCRRRVWPSAMRYTPTIQKRDSEYVSSDNEEIQVDVPNISGLYGTSHSSLASWGWRKEVNGKRFSRRMVARYATGGHHTERVCLCKQDWPRKDPFIIRSPT